MRALLRQRGAALLLFATLASLIGDSLLIVVLGIWVSDLTGSAGAAGLTFLFMALPSLVAPVIGVIIDRSQRKRFIILANLGTGCALVPLFVVAEESDVWIVYCVSFAYGLSLIAIPAALNGLLQELLPEGLLADANSLIQTFKESLRLAGPLAGSLLYANLGALPVIAIDIGTFALAACGFAALKVRERAREADTISSLPAEFLAGARFLSSDEPLRGLLIALAASFLVFGFAESIVFALSSALQRPPEFVGVLFALQGAGAVIGGMLAAATVHRFSETGTTALGLAAIALGMGLTIPAQLALTCVGMAIAGLGPPLLLVALFTMMQVRTPPNLMGRVSTTVEIVIGVPQTISIGIGAALIGVLGYQTLLAALVFVTLVAAGALALWSRSPKAPEAASHHSPRQVGEPE